MPQLHLPENHSEADLVLAGQIATSIECGELFIVWTHQGGSGARPTVAAQIREPINLTAELLNALFDCATEFLRAMTRPSLRPRPAAPGEAAA